MLELTKITIKELPHVYSWNQQDYMYCFNRPYFMGYLDEIFNTEEKHSTYYDAWERERVVQIITYKKYKIILPGKEYNGLHLLKYADFIQIENGVETHHAKIIDMFERGDGVNKMYEIMYYDVNKQNYEDLKQPVSNYLRSDVLTSRYSTSGLLRLIAFSGSTIVLTIYSLITPKIRWNAGDALDEVVNGLDVSTYNAKQEEWHCVFFLNNSGLTSFNRYLDWSGGIESGTGFTSQFTLTYDGVSKKVIERVKPEITKISGAVDLFRVQFAAKVTNMETIFFT